MTSIRYYFVRQMARQDNIAGLYDEHIVKMLATDWIEMRDLLRDIRLEAKHNAFLHAGLKDASLLTRLNRVTR